MCSRRQADKYIESRKVTINKRVATLGDKVRPGDEVRVNGNLLDNAPDRVYIALNKPAGIVCTTDRNEKGNIIDFVNFPMRVFNVGRLDKDSYGLILLTNDGDIVNKILRVENKHEKEYIVEVDKPITEDFIQKMSDGVSILGRMTRKCVVKQISPIVFNITLTQGLNRQIRRMCEQLGYEVVALQRVRIMNISLGKLPVGEWRFLTPGEQRELDELLSTAKSSTPYASRPDNESSKRRVTSRSNSRPVNHKNNRNSGNAPSGSGGGGGTKFSKKSGGGSASSSLKGKSQQPKRAAASSRRGAAASSASSSSFSKRRGSN